jgi:hypothetical protein
MNATVCDRCGRVVLLEDRNPSPVAVDTGIRRLRWEAPGWNTGFLDLCDPCIDELITSVREGRNVHDDN